MTICEVMPTFNHCRGRGIHDAGAYGLNCRAFSLCWQLLRSTVAAISVSSLRASVFEISLPTTMLKFMGADTCCSGGFHGTTELFSLNRNTLPMLPRLNSCVLQAPHVFPRRFACEVFRRAANGACRECCCTDARFDTNGVRTHCFKKYKWGVMLLSWLLLPWTWSLKVRGET